MIITKEQVSEMREALIDASPLSDRMKSIVKSQYDVSIIHRDVVRDLAEMVWSDFPEERLAELNGILEILGEQQ